MEAKIILNELESKTNLTPNILCRYGVVLSIKSSEPLKLNYDNTGQEFHRPILTGDYDLLLRELIREKEGKMIDDDTYFTQYLKAHIERGVRLLANEIQLCGSFENFIAEYFDPTRGGMI